MDLGYTIDYEKDIQTKFNKNENFIKSKTTQIADLQYEVELLTNASVLIIRGISDHIQSIDLHKIWLDFDGDKHEFKPDGKDSKTQLKSIEENYIFKNGKPIDVRLNKIALYGYRWELWLYYTYNGEEFVITLPHFKNANKDNYQSLNYSIMVVNDDSYETVFSTMFLSELKDGVTKFLNGEIWGG